MSHLNASEIVDFLEGSLPQGRQAHVAECARCRGEAERARAALEAARSETAPEPSPLFWEHFSARVRKAVAEEPRSAGRSRWIWAPLAAATAALALVIGAMVARSPLPPAPGASRDAAVTENAAGLPDAEGEEQWARVEDVADGVEWEDAADAGLAVHPGAADRAVLLLSDEQREELARLLQTEIGRLKS